MLRFTPSPTGDMQIGNLRVALLNYLISQQRQEPFLVRINDTNKASNIEGKDTEIMQILEKFALKHESVFHQSEHLHMHQTLAIRLLEEGKAFVCTCKEEETQTVTNHDSGKCFEAGKEQLANLKESGTSFVIRIKKPEDDIIFHDLINGEIKTTPTQVDSFVILDTKGIPSSHFACACDDMLSGITFIIGEEKYLSDTSKQIHIKSLLGYKNETLYAHLPKLEHSENTILIQSLFEEGFIPDAIINYLLLLDNAKAPQEIFTLPDAVTWFDLANITSFPSTFEKDTLRTINSKHLEMMEDKALSRLFGFADEKIGKLAKVYLDEASTIKELESKINPLFEPKNFENEWGKQMRILETLIQNGDMIDSFDDFKASLMQESGLKDENLLNPLRLLLTGANHGPELSKIYPFIKPYLLEIAA